MDWGRPAATSSQCPTRWKNSSEMIREMKTATGKKMYKSNPAQKQIRILLDLSSPVMFLSRTGFRGQEKRLTKAMMDRIRICSSPQQD